MNNTFNKLSISASWECSVFKCFQTWLSIMCLKFKCHLNSDQFWNGVIQKGIQKSIASGISLTSEYCNCSTSENWTSNSFYYWMHLNFQCLIFRSPLYLENHLVNKSKQIASQKPCLPSSVANNRISIISFSTSLKISGIRTKQNKYE